MGMMPASLATEIAVYLLSEVIILKILPDFFSISTPKALSLRRGSFIPKIERTISP